MNLTQAEVGEGRYLYCIVNGGTELELGEIGIEDSRVYTIPHEDIAAVVHACKANPYESKNEEKVKRWIFAHQYVIDQATKRFGTALPFTFDSIVKGDDKVVKDWLGKEHSKFKRELERLKDKSEYTVQIFCDESTFAGKVEGKSDEVRKLRGDIKTKPKGTAYLLERRLEGMIKDLVAAEANGYSKKFLEQIKGHVDELKAENPSKRVPEKWKDKLMILNLSCLIHKDRVEELGNALGEINKLEGFAVRFTGPWAPFSFARLEG
jgi:hypothetical protein